MDKRDANGLKQQWEDWKKTNQEIIPSINSYNSKIIIDFLNDMQRGLNVSKLSVKGNRSFGRLLSLKNRCLFFAKHFNKLDKITKEEASDFFNDMRSGKLKKSNGKLYKATGEYVKDFKCLMGWLKRTNRIKEDVSEYLQRKDDRKPPWVYLTESQIKELAESCDSDYRALIFFLFDSGIRPQEAYSIKVNDFSQDYNQLKIRDEISKTFGRTITLKLCSKLIKDYVQRNNLKEEDFLIIKEQPAFNKYLRTHAKQLFGSGKSLAKKEFNNMRLYDIRHNASCYWLPRYKKQSALMYRMGWKKENEIAYYSEFLGMSDSISDEDMVSEVERNIYQKDIGELKSQLSKEAFERKKLQEDFEKKNKNLDDLKNLFTKNLEITINLLKKSDLSSSELKGLLQETKGLEDSVKAMINNKGLSLHRLK